MAGMAVDGHYLKFATIRCEDVFFEVVNTDYESDSFKKSNKCHTRTIKINGNMFLVVDGKCLKFEERNKIDSGKADCLFQICCYRDSEAKSGSAVTLTVSDKEETRFICSCDDKNGKGVYAKKGPLPDNIDESYHEAMFFLDILKEQNNTYRIRSSLWPEWFLTFEETEADVVKLVLRKAGDDGEDGTDGLRLI